MERHVPNRHHSAVYTAIIQVLSERHLISRDELYSLVVKEIPPGMALRKQERDAALQFAKRQRQRGLPLRDYMPNPLRQQPLESRIETGRKALFRKKLYDLQYEGRVRLVDKDGQSYVEYLAEPSSSRRVTTSR